MAVGAIRQPFLLMIFMLGMSQVIIFYDPFGGRTLHNTS